MPEPISTTTATTIAVTGIKVSAISALIALITTDQDLLMVLIVGVVGGFAYIGKEFVLEEFLQSPLKNILNMPFSILMAISLTGIVFYGGKDGFNRHVTDLGVFVWIFLAFMASMNYNRVVKNVTLSILSGMDIALKRWKNK